MKMRVLVAVEEFPLRARLARVVQSCGYVAALARGARREPTRNLAAAIVAPTSFDDKGLALARELCADGCKVIVLTDSHEAAQMGARILPDAHAFLAQPVDEQRLTALLAEIAAAQASEGTAPTTVLRFEGRSLDLGGHAFVDENGREVPLTHAEFELLALFARSSGRVLSRDQLRIGISGRDLEPYDRSIDMLVARLRRKIEPNAKSPCFILTVPGVGYKFAPRVRQADLATTPPIEPQLKKASDAPRPAELRQLSVLACQIRGWAALSTQLDPEDEGELMSSIHRACADVAARFRGVVARILGDSLLIYFGYTEAQEHDPERAVRAGLELIGAIRNLDLPSALHPHIGIATGLMMVGASPGPPDEFAATGQALNLALRLQSAAPSDSVLITSRTRELVGDFFNYQEMEPLCAGRRPRAGYSVVCDRREQQRRTVRGTSSNRHVGISGSQAGDGPAAAMLVKSSNRGWPSRTSHGRARYRQVAAHCRIRRGKERRALQQPEVLWLAAPDRRLPLRCDWGVATGSRFQARRYSVREACQAHRAVRRGRPLSDQRGDAHS